MNVALQSDTGFYIASVRKIGGSFAAQGRRVSKDGRLEADGQAFICGDKRAAEHKVRDIVRTKVKRRGWKLVSLQELPKQVVKFLDVPPEMQCTPEELVFILRSAAKERYVVFENIEGLEEYFDVGVQYLGYDTDSGSVKVYDRFGVMREVFQNRLRSVQPTEQAVEATGDKHRQVVEGLEAV